MHQYRLCYTIRRFSPFYSQRVESLDSRNEGFEDEGVTLKKKNRVIRQSVHKCGRWDRVDIGLNLKSGNKGLVVANYCRPRVSGEGREGWEFSPLAVRLLQEYKAKHAWVFHALASDPDGGFEGLHLDEALK